MAGPAPKDVKLQEFEVDVVAAEAAGKKGRKSRKQKKITCTNPGNRRVKQQLSRIHGRFHPHKKLLVEEYEALEHLLSGLDHAILSLFDNRYQCNGGSSCQDEMYRAMYVTIDQENEHAVFLNTSALVDPASSNEQAMQMYYKPPFDEGGPSSNYSLVWIIKGPPESVHPLPLVPSKPAKKDLLTGIAGVGEDVEIEPGVPYHISNFIAPNAFLTARPSTTRPGLNITFQEDEVGASDIYFHLGENERYAMVTNENYYLLPVVSTIEGGQSFVISAADHRIHAEQLLPILATDSDQTEGVQAGVPTEAFVWQVNNHEFQVAGGCCRPIQPA